MRPVNVENEESNEKLEDRDEALGDVPTSLVRQIDRLDQIADLLMMYGQIIWLLVCLQISVFVFSLLDLFRVTSGYFLFMSATVLVFSIITLVKRDSLTSSGNDIFQVISDALEDGSLRKVFSTKIDRISEANEAAELEFSVRKSEKVSISFGDVRLIMRQFVSASKIPLIRNSQNAELSIIFLNVLCFGLIALLQQLLS